MLINCSVYQEGRKLAEIRPDEISEYLKHPDAFVWVALADPGPGELAAMEHEFDLHELAIEDAHHGHQRPKVEEYDDQLFVVMQMIELDADGELQVGELDVFVGANFVLSVRNRAKKGFADVRARVERDPDLLRFGSGFVLYALMDAVVDRYFPVLDNFEVELEQIEESMFEKAAGRTSVEALYKLKHKAMVLKHAVAPLLEATGKLHGGRVPHPCVTTQEYYRDVFDHLSRINQSIDSLREMVTTATSVNLALVTIAENEVVKRLAATAALVAVPTLIAGIYGMNFEHMPEIKWVWGYPFAIGLMLTIDAWLFWRFRKAKWL